MKKIEEADPRGGVTQYKIDCELSAWDFDATSQNFRKGIAERIK